MASLFIGFLVEKYVTCQSRKSADFGWHRFRFAPCLVRIKRVVKSEAMLALLNTSNGKPV